MAIYHYPVIDHKAMLLVSPPSKHIKRIKGAEKLMPSLLKHYSPIIVNPSR